MKTEHELRLQGCLDRIAAGESAGAVLRSLRARPEDAALAADLAVALALRAQLSRGPSPASRAAMQARIQVAFEEDRRRGMGGWWSRRGIGLRTLTLRLGGAALALLLALGGGVVVSAESVPGQALYPFKRAAESARLAFRWSPEARARLWLDLSAARTDEMAALALDGKAPPQSLVFDWVDAHRQARQNAMESGDPNLMAAVEAQTTSHRDQIEALPDAPRLAQALGELDRVTTPAAPAPPEDTPAAQIGPQGDDEPTATASRAPTASAVATRRQRGGGEGPPRATRTPGGRPGRGEPRATMPPATIEAWQTEQAIRRQTEQPGREDRRATERAERRGTERPPTRRPAASPEPTQVPPGADTPTPGAGGSPGAPTARPTPTLPDPRPCRPAPGRPCPTREPRPGPPSPTRDPERPSTPRPTRPPPWRTPEPTDVPTEEPAPTIDLGDPTGMPTPAAEGTQQPAPASPQPIASP